MSVNVLIAEREAGMRACLRFLMERVNHSFSIAKDGAERWRYLMVASRTWRFWLSRSLTRWLMYARCRKGSDLGGD